MFNLQFNFLAFFLLFSASCFSQDETKQKKHTEVCVVQVEFAVTKFGKVFKPKVIETDCTCSRKTRKIHEAEALKVVSEMPDFKPLKRGSSSLEWHAVKVRFEAEEEKL